jgi:alkylation response protein AidB-like acyl-CoA dehydrogenase
MRRTIFAAEHEALRESVSRFLDAEVVPRYPDWERAGIVPREEFARAAALGLVGMSIDERHGGSGTADFRFNAVVTEECHRRGLTGYAMALQITNDVTLPYLLELSTEEQRQRWLPSIAAGETVTAIAMTEPGAGSDLAALRTSARRRNGDYVLNGTKTFITNAINADLVLVAARTGTTGTHRDISLLAIERGTAGFTRGRPLHKLGQHAQDTAELHFQDAVVPAENLLGAEGEGFRHMARNLAQERLSIALGAVAAAEGALQGTLQYVSERCAFGRPVGTFQHSRFTLAQCRTEVEVAQAFADRCLHAHVSGELAAEDASMAKLWCTEMLGRVTDACLQLHGGYGYMTEYPIARAYADARVQRIYGGTNEIMKEMIGRAMGLGEPS